MMLYCSHKGNGNRRCFHGFDYTGAIVVDRW